MHDKLPVPSTNPAEEPDASVGYEGSGQLAPRIYVASLSDYNNGRLHGRWLDAARDSAAIRAEIQAMLAESSDPGAEEWAIHDYDEFGSWQVDEFDSIELVSRIARGIQQHGPAFAAWADVNEGEPERFDDFEAAYLGHYESAETYCYQQAEDFGYHAELEKLPVSLQSYVHIDYAAMARDLDAGGDLYVYPAPDGGVWLFDGNV